MMKTLLNNQVNVGSNQMNYVMNCVFHHPRPDVDVPALAVDASYAAVDYVDDPAEMVEVVGWDAGIEGGVADES